MAQRTLAPWAELVPGRGPTTAEELARLPDDGWVYELVEGRLVRMPPAGFDHGDIEFGLGGALRAFVEAAKLGRVVGGEAGFRLSRPGEPDTVLGADVAFVRAERLPPRGSDERRGFPRLAPDLVVEVASPDQHRAEMAAKARTWLAAGVRLLWVVWPASRQVDLWRPGGEAPTATLGPGDSLDGLEVVPGFRYPLAQLFA
jgi:Uma2 family endonuclease